MPTGVLAPCEPDQLLLFHEDVLLLVPLVRGFWLCVPLVRGLSPDTASAPTVGPTAAGGGD